MINVYVEHSALTDQIRALARAGSIELIHFPYDPDSRSQHLPNRGVPSAAQWRDLNMPFSELPGTFDDYVGSEHLEAIVALIGRQNRRDALHVDSAFKSGCAAFLTRDTDILSQRAKLEQLLNLKFFHPDDDADNFARFVSQSVGAA